MLPELRESYSKISVVYTYRNHLAFGRHVRGAVAQAKLGLQGVEIGLQLSFLLHTRWFVFTPGTNTYFTLS